MYPKSNDRDMVKILPSLILVNEAGETFSYVLDGKPMSKQQYIEFQNKLNKIKVTLSMRIIEPDKQKNVDALRKKKQDRTSRSRRQK